MRSLTALGSAVNVDYAFSSGWLGHGVIVGVVDDGVAANIELDGQIDTAASRDFGRYLAEDRSRGSLADAKSDHGTLVASVIAAKQNSSGTVGYAPRAKIAVLRITDVDADGGERYTATHEIEAIDHAIAKGLKILNRSLMGGANPGLSAAMNRYAATGGLMINSAGNEGGTAPGEAPNVTASNRASWLLVGALTPGTLDLASYSAPAGSLADRYVVAPGTQIAMGVDNVVMPFSGTSAAAPVVAGLAADILSKWPQLSGQQVGDIILNTARDLGTPGVDAVFGHGLVDFRAALQPVDPVLSNGAVETAAANAILVVPDAIAPQIFQTALANVTVLDSYGRDYNVSLAGRIVPARASDDHWLRRRMLAGYGAASLDGDRVSARFTYASRPADPDGVRRTVFFGGRLTYRAGHTTVHASLRELDLQQGDLMGLAIVPDAALAYAPQMDRRLGIDRAIGASRVGVTFSGGGGRLSSARAVTASFMRGATTLQASLIAETDTVLSAPARGALKLGRGTKTFVAEARRTFGVGSWRVDTYASLGLTRLLIDDASLVTRATPLVGSRFGVRADGPALGGFLSFSVAQPLAIESGTARLTYGTAYDVETGALSYNRLDVPLTGKRRILLAGAYAKPLAGGELRVGWMHAVQDNETAALLSFAMNLGS